MNSSTLSFVLVSVVIIGCSGSSSPGLIGLGGGGTVSDPDAGVEEDAGKSSATNGGTGTEQVNGACPSRPSKLKGIAASGEACSGASDCEPTCCSCDDKGQWLAAACVEGKCASGAEACSRTKKPALCSSSPPPPTPTPTPPKSLDDPKAQPPKLFFEKED